MIGKDLGNTDVNSFLNKNRARGQEMIPCSKCGNKQINQNANLSLVFLFFLNKKITLSLHKNRGNVCRLCSTCGMNLWSNRPQKEDNVNK